MKYIQTILGILVIGSLGGYECGNATFLQAIFNAVMFSALIFLLQAIKTRKKRGCCKKRNNRQKDKINNSNYTW